MLLLGMFGILILLTLTFGWLLPLILGISRLRRGTGGIILTTLGGLWGLAGLTILALVLSSFFMLQRFSQQPEIQTFDPATFQGETGQIVVPHKGSSQLLLYRKNENQYLQIQTTNGIMIAPPGSYLISSYSITVLDSNQTLWLATTYPDKEISIAPNSSTDLTAGPPLVAKVDVSRTENGTARMDLRLQDLHANKFSISKSDGTPLAPPRFEARTVQGLCVWQGKFEFG